MRSNMRSNTLILLAVSVFSHLATAAVIRHGPFARSGNFIRSFNQSSIPPAPVAHPPASTSDSLAAAASTLAPLPSKQVGSVAAVGNGPGAASVEPDATVTSLERPSPSPALPSSTASKSSLAAALSTGGGPSIAATTKQVGSVPAVGNGPGAASLESRTTPTPSTKQSPLFSKTPSSSATSTSFSRLFTLNTGVGSENAPPSTSETLQGRSSLPSPSAASISTPSQSLTPTITDIPTSTDIPGRDENMKVANEFNSYFDTMNPDSGCNAALNSEATACIGKQLATCGSDRKYLLTRCPAGQECRALPLDNGIRGIYIQCITPSDAAAKLSPDQSSSVIAAPSTPNVVTITQITTVQGSSTTIAKGSVTPFSQSGVSSSKTSLSTGALSLPTVIIPSEPKPTFSFGPTATTIKTSSASPTPDHASFPGSTVPSTTAHKATQYASVTSVHTTLLTSNSPSPASKASTSSAHTSASSPPSESGPGIVIIPVPRITNNPTKPT